MAIVALKQKPTLKTFHATVHVTRVEQWCVEAETAFEWLAQKEARDPDRRQRLLEVAGFYRSLAGIIPAMPTRCKINNVALPVTRAERWKARAEECRTLADCFTDSFCRGQLTRLAQSYDQMAVAAE